MWDDFIVMLTCSRTHEHLPQSNYQILPGNVGKNFLKYLSQVTNSHLHQLLEVSD